jgi:hypothetical protein
VAAVPAAAAAAGRVADRRVAQAVRRRMVRGTARRRLAACRHPCEGTPSFSCRSSLDRAHATATPQHGSSARADKVPPKEITPVPPGSCARGSRCCPAYRDDAARAQVDTGYRGAARCCPRRGAWPGPSHRGPRLLLERRRCSTALGCVGTSNADQREPTSPLATKETMRGNSRRTAALASRSFKRVCWRRAINPSTTFMDLNRSPLSSRSRSSRCLEHQFADVIPGL